MADRGFEHYTSGNLFGVDPSISIAETPLKTYQLAQSFVYNALGERDANSDSDARYPLSLNDDFNRFMTAPVAELEALIGHENFVKVMDRWATEATFDPDRVVVDEANWLIFQKGNPDKQVVVSAGLAADQTSSNGLSWQLGEFFWIDSPSTDGRWDFAPTGEYYHFQNAQELRSIIDAHEIDEDLAVYFSPDHIDEVEIVRIDAKYVAGLNLNNMDRDIGRKSARARVGIYADANKRLKQLMENSHVMKGRNFVPLADDYGLSLVDEWFGMPAHAAAPDDYELDYDGARKYGDFAVSIFIENKRGSGVSNDDLLESIKKDFGDWAYIIEESLRDGWLYPTNAIDPAADHYRVYTTIDAAKALEKTSLTVPELARLSSAAKFVSYDPDDWHSDLDELKAIDWAERDKPLYPNLLNYIIDANPEKNEQIAPQRVIEAIAGPYDIRIEQEYDTVENEPVISASLMRVDGKAADEPNLKVYKRISSYDYEGVRKAQLAAYQDLFDKRASDRFRGVESITPGHTSFKSVEEAVRIHSEDYMRPAWQLRAYALKSTAFEEPYFTYDYEYSPSWSHKPDIRTVLQDATHRIAQDEPYCVRIFDEQGELAVEYNRESGWLPPHDSSLSSVVLEFSDELAIEGTFPHPSEFKEVERGAVYRWDRGKYYVEISCRDTLWMSNALLPVKPEYGVVSMSSTHQGAIGNSFGDVYAKLFDTMNNRRAMDCASSLEINNISSPRNAYPNVYALVEAEGLIEPPKQEVSPTLTPNGSVGQQTFNSTGVKGRAR